MKNPLLAFFSLVWITIVFISYFKSNNNHLDAFHSNFGKLLIAGFFIGLFFVIFKFVLMAFKKDKGAININIFKIFIYFVLILGIIYNVISYDLNISSFKSGYEKGVFAKSETAYAVFPHASDVPEDFEILLKENDLVVNTNEIVSAIADERAGNFFVKHGFLTKNYFLLKFLAIPLFSIICLYFFTFVTGSFLLNLFFKKKLKIEVENFEYLLCSVGLGMAILSFMLFILSFFHLFNVLSVGILFFIGITLSYRQIPELLHLTFKSNFSIKLFSHFSLALTIFGVLCAFNIIDILRPIPASWDETISYINIPHLLSENNGLFGRMPYAFGLIQSVGFLLSENSAVAMFFALFAGFGAISTLYFILKKFFSDSFSFYLATTFYSLPFVFWITGVDIKPDLALVFIANLAILNFYYWLHNKQEKNYFLYLCSFLLGFAMSIKYTVLILIVTFFIALFYIFFKRIGLIAGFLGSASILFLAGILKSDISIWGDNALKIISLIAFGVAIILTGIIAFSKNNYFWQKFKKVLLCGLLVFIPLSIWFANNYIHYKSLNFSTLLYGKFQTNIDYKSLGVDRGLCQGADEEMQRYLGGDSIVKALFSLPWDVTMNNYLHKLHVDIGPLFLAFIVILILYLFKKNTSDSKNKQNSIFTVIEKNRIWIHLLLFSFIYYFFWTFAARGIIWYGITGFIGLIILSGLGFCFLERESKYMKYLLGAVLAILFITNLSARYTWAANAKLIGYINGYINESQFMDYIFPNILAGSKIINTSQKDTKIIRAGTYMKYWINNNYKRVIDDDGVDVLNSSLTVGKENADKRFESIKDFVKNLNLVYDSPSYWLYKIE